MDNILITNVQLFDGQKLHDNLNVIVKAGIVEKIFDESLTFYPDSYNVIDGTGKLLSPGFIDLHVHLREPGYEYKETITSGSLAAARGGFTSICCMPNTQPIADNAKTIKYILEKANHNNGVKVYPIAAITVYEAGKDLTDFLELKTAGAVALSDDGRGVQLASVMQNAYAEAVKVDLPIIIHAEDDSLAAGGHIHAGIKAEELKIKGIPDTSESIMVAREILLAKTHKAHVHFAHLSAADSVVLIRRAKADGYNVTAEVTPQHLVMNEQNITANHGYFKVNPPIRSMEDQSALIEGLLDGTIDAIATDHAPHAESEKDKAIVDASFGMTGLETAFAVLYSKLVLTDKVPLEIVLRALTKNPAKIMNGKIGSATISEGSTADLVLIDLQKKLTVSKEMFLSKAKNSPFLDWELQAWPIMTLVNGKIIFNEIV